MVLGPSGAIWGYLGLARLGSSRLGSAWPGSAQIGSAWFGASWVRLGSARPGSAKTGSARPGSTRSGIFSIFVPPKFRTVVWRGTNVLFIVKTYVFDKKSGRWLGEEKIADSGIVWGCLGHLGAALLGSAQLGPGPA